MEDSGLSCELPGFRFHPTEEELVDFYLRNVIFGKKWEFDVIGLLNIYRYPPWDLPGLAKIGEREWYFFVQRDRKQSNGGRLSRTTEHGFWKATGSDRKVVTLSNPKRVIGYRKTLVFYKGRAPRGTKTDWVMNEYRFPDNWQLPKDIVLCKVYMKATSLKVLEHWAAEEEDSLLVKSVQFSDNSDSSFSYPTPTSPPPLSYTSNSNSVQPLSTSHVGAPPPLPLPLLKDEKIFEDNNDHHFKVSINGLRSGRSTSLKLPFGPEELPDLQVPCFGTDWAQAQEPFSSQIRSPWLDNILNQFTLTPPPNLLSIIES